MRLPTKVNFSQPAVWTAVHEARTGPPPIGDIEEIQSWIHLQHVASPFDRAVAEAVDQVIKDHRGTTEACLAISGERHVGKTDAFTGLLVHRSMNARTAWRARQSTGWRHVPYVFVEATSNPTAKMVMGATCRFLDLPDAGDESKLRDRLCKALPEMGVKAIGVDESQNFRRSSPTAKTIADGLRGLLHLPVPMIYSGLDLRRSALLKRFIDTEDPDSADQIIERSTILDLSKLSDKQGIDDLVRVIRRLEKRLILIDGFTAPGLADKTLVQALIVSKSGRPGSILETIKKAAADAMDGDRCLSSDLLYARLPEKYRPVPERAAA